MGKEELIKNLRQKITDIETRPKARDMLKGIQKGCKNSSEPIKIQDTDPQQKPKMFWGNLKNNKCPVDGYELTWTKDGRQIKCMVCSFKIGIDKFNKYSMDQNNNPFG